MESPPNPQISIILPAYNGESTILNSIDSILSQTYTNFELIICDDGSTDNTREVIAKLSDKRIKIIYNNINLGLGATLNKLMLESHENSKYIAMAEQDDYYYLDRIKLEKDFLDKNPDYGMVSGIAEHWDGNRTTMKFPGLLEQGDQYPKGEEMFKLNYREQVKVVNSCLMIRKIIHQKNQLKWSNDYPNISVDWDYILRFSLVSKIAGLNQTLVRLDRRPDRKSLTQNNKIKFDTSRRLIKDFYTEFAYIITKEDYCYALATQGYLESKRKRHIWRIIHTLFVIINDPNKKRRKQEFINLLYIIDNKIKENYYYYRKNLFDSLAWKLSYKKIKIFLELNEVSDIIEATKLYTGHGYYDRISMSQRNIEIEKLAHLVIQNKPNTILEIGTNKGGTLFLWSRIISAKQIISIDLPDGNFGGGYNNKKEKLYKSFVADKSTHMHLFQLDSHKKETLDLIIKCLKGNKIDFLFIDGDHTYEGVKKDFEMYASMMSPKGIIAFHDIVENTTSHPDASLIQVPKFWNEIKKQYKYQEIIESPNQTSMGIGVLFV